MTKTETIEFQLDVMRSLLLPLGVSAVSLNYNVTDQDKSRRTLSVERHGHRAFYATVSTRPHIREQGLKSFKNFLNVDPDVANRILDTAEYLSRINDMGSWPLETDDRERAVVDGNGYDGTKWPALPGFKRRYDNLCTTLKLVDRIEVSIHTKFAPKHPGAVKPAESAGKAGKGIKTGTSRKGWLRFMDPAGEELASISINHLASSMRDWYGTDDAAHGTADANCGRWAHQLGISLDEFMDAALDLLSFDSLLQPTEILLDRYA